MISETQSPVRVSFTTHFAYDLHFTRGVFSARNPLVTDLLSAHCGSDRGLRVLGLVDEGVAAAWPSLLVDMDQVLGTVPGMVLGAPSSTLLGGEEAKDGLGVALECVERMRAARVCRHSMVVAVGGGAFLDAVGLGAALFHRGVRLLRVPTTVLAQCDSGVGVKNGVNLDGVKNLIGVFAPPVAVVNDFSFLDTLEVRDWRAGISEAFKVGLIKDVHFLRWLHEHADRLRLRDEEAMEYLVRRCAALHVEHIQTSGDPFELGSARPLDFGHWAAHRLESLSGHELRHGEAVAIGIGIDLFYACRLGLISADDVQETLHAMRQCGLPLWHEALESLDAEGRPCVLRGIDEFREHLGGTLHVTFPNPVGQRIELTEMDRSAVIASIEDLRVFATGSVQ